MKKLLLLLLCSLFAINGFAQDHLIFKGIPIDGSLTSFCQKLKDKGFTPIKKVDSLVLFTGDFTDRKATVGVGASNDGKSVDTVMVLFDESDEWKTLLNTYNNFKELYTLKYGAPSDCVENNPSHNDSNTENMYNLGQGTINYTCVWLAAEGTINISIVNSSYSKGLVIIKYTDTQNTVNKIQKYLEEI